MSRRPELTGVPGVPETLLGALLTARLPEGFPGAPWKCRCEGVVWLTRGGRAATAALPPALARRARGLGVIGGMVRYTDSPVGAYEEVFGMVGSVSGLEPWVHVAFMAVDSEASLVAGRTNWAMPKTLAVFTGGSQGGGARTGETRIASGSDTSWQVSATSRVLAPGLRLAGRGLTRQQFPDGAVRSSLLQAAGRVRPATVAVEVTSAGPLATWLRPGRHLGLVLESVTLTLGAPRLG